MARIILFGGHGKIALLTEPLLAERGDTVTAVIRNPDHAEDVRAAGADPLVADVEQLDTAELSRLIEGHDAVVWSAGAGGGDPRRTRAVDHDAAVRTMDAAEQAGVRRYIMVSYFRSSPDHGVNPENSFHAYAEAKAAADEHLRASGLDWTVLGPSTLTLEEPSGRIDTAASESSSVSRANVARVIAATLADDGTIRRTIRFNDGDTPIEEALRA
ncbi:SDR family oxidoreductase [Leucobacter ruminantium]|uniref:SDR family oxidoreductase n=1 Tax=Leucobacter ruminantium TaxID=1289170 RepID=A0A939S0A0_9MICO|nr:SDR family oxidoreductase [Leucobacter ruminantium]MBO1806661.1 SDR family oxidoreductase [Leucobacter ruminantium]